MCQHASTGASDQQSGAIIQENDREDMEPQELQEQTEHAQRKGEKAIGLTTAIVAVLLAIATQLAHRAHTEEIKLMTKANDGWAFYQAKHARAHLYGKYAEDEAISNKNEIAAVDFKRSIAEECGAPAEDNCTSPILRDSPARKQLMDQMSAAKTEPGHEAGTLSGGVKGSGAAGRHKTQKSPASRKEGAVDIEEHTHELDAETDLITSRANFYDAAELLLDISIVLCSITLLAETKLYWRLSFASTAIGIGIIVWGWFLR